MSNNERFSTPFEMLEDSFEIGDKWFEIKIAAILTGTGLDLQLVDFRIAYWEILEESKFEMAGQLASEASQTTDLEIGELSGGQYGPILLSFNGAQRSVTITEVTFKPHEYDGVDFDLDLTIGDKRVHVRVYADIPEWWRREAEAKAKAS